MKDFDFGSFRLSGFGFNTTLLVLNCTDLAKITFSVSKKKILEIFLNRSKNPKNYFHAKPFGKSFNHIGNRPFFKFQSQKGKIDKIIDTTLHFRTKTSDFFFCLSLSILLPMPNPFGKSFTVLGTHIGKRPFFKFQSQKVKIRCLTKKSLHFCLLSRVLIIGNYCYASARLA